MAAPTWAEIKAEIEAEYDLTEETFVDATELLQYANSGIEDVEKEIHTINDNYFHSESSISFVNGVSDYSLPSDIFANKITGWVFDDGSKSYMIKELKDLSKIPDIQTTDYYQYRIINTTAGGTKIRVYPTPSTTETNNTIFYRRRIVLFVDDSSVLDVPEAKEFLKQYVIDKAANKERMTPDAQESPALMKKRKSLLDSLAKMIDDDNTEVYINTDYYEEFL